MVTPTLQPFGIGDLVEIDTVNVRALARVRESSGDGRLHLALEVGQYLPWVDDAVHIRHFGNDPQRSCTAKILHAGASSALLQILEMVDQVQARLASVPPSAPIASVPHASMPSIDDDW